MRDYIIGMNDGSRVRISASDAREADLRATSLANSVTNWCVVSLSEDTPERIQAPTIHIDDIVKEVA